MNKRQLRRLAADLGKRFADVDSWQFSFEYNDIFQFTRENLILSCTPDWDTRGEICIQLDTDDGRNLTGWDVKYSGNLTAEQFVQLMKPYLAKAAKKLPKLIQPGVTYQQYGKQLLYRHARWRENNQRMGWIQPHVGQLAAQMSGILRKRLSPKALHELSSSRPMKDAIKCSELMATAGAALVEAWASIGQCTSKQATAAIELSTWGRAIADEAWALARLFEFRLEWGSALNSSARSICAFGFKHQGKLIANAFRSPMGHMKVNPRVFYGVSEEAAQQLATLNRRLDLMY